MTVEIFRYDKLNPVKMPDHRGALIKPGGKVRLLKPHPHAERIGTYQGVERTAAGWGCLVRFEESEDGCYVFEAEQWERVSK